MMDELVFVTSNGNKVKEAETILDFPVKQFEVELDEVQEMSLEVVVRKKAEKAFEIVKKPVFVDDVGMYIDAWNGFPGPFVKYVHQAGNGNELLLKWINLETNKHVMIVCGIGYHDGENIHVFLGEVSGTMVNTRGERGWGFDPIFIPDGYQQTWAEMTEQEKNAISHRRRALDQFKKHLSNLKKVV